MINSDAVILSKQEIVNLLVAVTRPCDQAVVVDLGVRAVESPLDLAAERGSSQKSNGFATIIKLSL